MELLRCEGLTKRYGSGEAQVTALAGVDLVMERGEFAAVVGASGSGKSTLLHILGSVDTPTSGQVLVDGTPLTGMTRTQAALFRRRKVGIVYQFYNLVPTLTVRQNILLVTHDESIALGADRILTMEDGRILRDEARR